MNKLVACLGVAVAIAWVSRADDLIYLVRGDTSTQKDKNSFHLGTNWSDEAVPHDDADYLVDLGPGKYLRTNGAAYPDPFTGRSLTFGNSETNAEGWLCLHLTRPVTINDARLVRGGFYLPKDPNWRRYSGSSTVYSTAEAPFAFEADGRVDLRHAASISGAADAVFVLRPREGAKSLAESFDFKLESATLATNYHGKIIVEGTNVVYYVTHSGGGALPPYWLGDQPAEFMPDAVTLKNGGGIGLDSAFGLRFDMGTRGITVGEGGGTLRWTGSERPFRAQIAGEGILRVAGSGVLFRAMQIDCAGVSVCTNAHMCLHEDVVWGAATTLEVKNGGSITTMSTGLRPIRTRLESGARIICGVACAPTTGSASGRYYNDGTLMLFRPTGGDVGTLELTEGSEIALDGRPIKLRLEDERVAGRYQGRIPMLRIPTSVRAVTAADFTAERTKGNSGMGQPDATVDRIVEVETVGGMQTVFLTLPQSYVVPAGTPGVEPAEPYDTWETAATDLGTGAAYAIANNRNLNVKPGTYAIRETINVAAPVLIRSDDGTGNLATETTIIDGGATPEDATTGVQPVKLSKAGATLQGFTIRNGYGSAGGGGVLVTASNAAVLDCVITNCVATNTSFSARGGGIFASGVQTDILRTTVVGCKANNGGGISATGASRSSYASADGYYRIIGCRILDNEATHADENATGGGFCGSSFGSCWVEDCLFRGNWLTSTLGKTSSNRRGAAMELSAYSIVTNCVFEKHGSGTRSIIDAGNPCKVTGCVFRGLTGTSGQIVGDNNLTASIVENCVFTNNSAQVLYGNAHFKNCLFAYNTAQLNTQSALFENCTVVTNARGFHIESGTCKPKFINCISAGNGNLFVSNSRGWNNFAFIWQESTNNVTVSNCCFEGVTRWTNDMQGMPPEVWSMETLDPTGKSFAADPKFVDKANGDFRLKRRSPCRDAGILRDWMADDIDLDGLPRVVTDGKTLAENPDALPDMGCYENQAPCPGLLLLVW